MNIKKKLGEIGLDSSNSVVIGSGVLSAMNLRQSNDIDVVVSVAEYDRLARTGRFSKKQSHGREILADELFEIGTSWGVLGKDQVFNDLLNNSTDIEGVRYITIDFLLAIKRSWLNDADVRQKDIDDVRLIETYLKEQK